ncbi:MAG TPA: amino acid adenylation domain-containing protein [Bryobacteraceae bacterium]|jgi:amino acid adenylation domain-containing protein/non-ribosomal peptide synthase protein (TIGR01720 family)|nr:amino acid adenylation domain-containing protein [Bryobacteraceae bacterium]
MNLADVERVECLSPLEKAMVACGPATLAHAHILTAQVAAPLDRDKLQHAIAHVAHADERLRTFIRWKGLDRPLALVRKEIQALTGMENAGSGLDASQPLVAWRVGELPRGFELQLEANPVLFDVPAAKAVLCDAIESYSDILLAKSPPLRIAIPAPSGPTPAPVDEAVIEDFWKQSFTGVENSHGLPLERIHRLPAAYGERSADCLAIPQSFWRELAARNLSAETVLTAAWTLLADSFLAGSPAISGFALATGATGLLGSLRFTAPLVLRVDERASCREWLADVHAQLETLKQRPAPLETIEDWIGAEHGSLVQCRLSYVANPRPIHAPINSIRVSEAQSPPLSLTLEGEPDALLRADYDANRFDPNAIQLLLNRTVALLCRCVTFDRQAVGEITALEPDERQLLVNEWGDGGLQPSQGFIHEVFAAVAEASPASAALRWGTQALSYAELNAWSNRLARYLQQLGVSRNVRVGIYLDRGFELVCSLLAVLKAGGVCLPLDPANPSARNEQILADSNTEIVLCDSPLAFGIRPRGCKLICLDRETAHIDAFDPENLITPLAPDNLAYMIYTSGSTGAPKGVLVPHRGIVNLARTQAEAFGIRSGTTVLNFASFTFDAAVSEWSTAFAAGATLVIPTDVRSLSGRLLCQFLYDEHIEVATLPPSVLATLPEEPLPSLRTLVIAGEACDPELAGRWASGRKLVNAYGPTESTVCATMWNSPSGSSLLPIGKPIPNLTAYVLSHRGSPVCAGALGELCIGGLGLALGYHAQPAATAERFRPDPFSNLPGARLFRTGDRVRWSPAGQLEFLGRIDRQVKVRGFRIEPAEIETLLRQHSAIRDAVVDAVAGRDSQKRLVAWIVPQAVNSPPSKDDLREFLSQRLPSYMVPAAFVLLSEFPLTISGKIDRQRLPLPTSGNSLSLSNETTMTPRERKLAAIWSAVLGVPDVSPHDNFFSLGGDSILSIQVIARANDEGLRLTTQQFFDHQTIAELAAVAEETGSPIVDSGANLSWAPLTPIQSWFFDCQPPEARDHYNQAVTFEIGPAVAAAAIERALSCVISRHDALRLRFVPTESGWQQQVTEPAARFFTCCDLSGVPASAHGSLATTIANRLQSSLDLGAGILLRSVYFYRGPSTPPLVFIVVHHLVIDGVSWRTLLIELATACRQISDGQAVHLGSASFSFCKWAHILTQEALSGRWDSELPWWTSVLSSAPGRLACDWPDGINNRKSARTLSAMLNAGETQSLLHTVPNSYGTQINDALLSAFSRALAEWTGHERCFFDIESHGRDGLPNCDLAKTIGWLTTFYPVCLNLGLRVTPADALLSVQEQLRRVPSHGFGYLPLLYASASSPASGALAALPKPEIVFNYLGQISQASSEGAAFVPRSDFCGNSQADAGLRTHVLEMNAVVAEGCLQTIWTYSENLHRPETVQRLSNLFLACLRALIEHCESQARVHYTPADFPEAGLSVDDLEQIVAMIGGGIAEPV